jgi:hypothetical protein
MLDPATAHNSYNLIPNRTAAASSVRQEADSVEGVSRSDSRQQKPKFFSKNSSSAKKDSVQISEEARAITKLVAQDREVRSHEAAHAAAGGQYAGAPALTYKRGPDGRSYATSGEVSIDVAVVDGDPKATLDKAQVVRAAALAPSQPSGKDMRVASRASVMAAEARAELARQVDEELHNLPSADDSQPDEAVSDVASSDLLEQQEQKENGPAPLLGANG